MEADILQAAGNALLILLEWHRLMYLFAGVCMGLALGILPGIGGLAGTALLLPFTYAMDAPSAFALLLGLGATTTTADPISAIVLGAPGHAASAATTLDGYPMTKRGEAGRALGASYTSALIGGLFGAILLGVSLPILRPLVLHLGSPELLAFAVFGISMVATLSGNAPLRGATIACFGVMLAMVGTDPNTGTQRWTFGSLYLWDAIPLVPFTLGIFALPELCDLFIGRTAVVKALTVDTRKGLLEGAKDCLRHWFLVLRCSWLGAAMGTVPGIGVTVIDWISYGHALRTEKGAQQTFGRGDVRGVIAAESATNSREGGALVPTVVFGVPSSAGMAILLGAFIMHGLTPGPDMITKHLDITYSMVWSIAIANILGSGLCFLFSGQFAKLSTLRYTLILPCILCLIFIGAYQGKRQWGDLYTLLALGTFGWTLKHLKWPRPPLVLGYILGTTVERNMFISIQAYGLEWLTHPVVVLLFALAALSLLRPLYQDLRSHAKTSTYSTKANWSKTQIFPALMLAVFVAMLLQALPWPLFAKIIPLIVGSGAILFCSLSLLNDIYHTRDPQPAAGALAGGSEKVNKAKQKLHMDIMSNVSHLPLRMLITRAAGFLGWLLAFLTGMALIGFIPTVPIFIIALMRIEGPEKWRIVLPMAILMTIFVYVLFDSILHMPWPASVIGDFIPQLKAIPSV